MMTIVHTVGAAVGSFKNVSLNSKG
jgi:hypothetical protein